MALFEIALELGKQSKNRQNTRVAVVALQKALHFAVKHDQTLLEKRQFATRHLHAEVGGFGSMSSLVAVLHFHLAEAYHNGWVSTPAKDCDQALQHLKLLENEWSRLTVASSLSPRDLRCAHYQIFCLSRLALHWKFYHTSSIFGLPDPQPPQQREEGSTAEENGSAQPSGSNRGKTKHSAASLLERAQARSKQRRQYEAQQQLEAGYALDWKQRLVLPPAAVMEDWETTLPMQFAQCGLRASIELSGGAQFQCTAKTAHSYQLLGMANTASSLIDRSFHRRNACKAAYQTAFNIFKELYGDTHRSLAINLMQGSRSMHRGHHWMVRHIRGAFTDALALLGEYYADLPIDPPLGISGREILPTPEKPFLFTRAATVWADPPALLVADVLHTIGLTHQRDGSNKTAAKFFYRELAVLYRCLNLEHPRIARVRKLAEELRLSAKQQPYSFPRRSAEWHQKRIEIEKKSQARKLSRAKAKKEQELVVVDGPVVE